MSDTEYGEKGYNFCVINVGVSFLMIQVQIAASTHHGKLSTTDTQFNPPQCGIWHTWPNVSTISPIYLLYILLIYFSREPYIHAHISFCRIQRIYKTLARLTPLG